MKSGKDEIEQNRVRIHQILSARAEALSCRQLAALTGLRTRMVSGCLRALKNAGSVKQVGCLETVNDYGKHERLALYEMVAPYVPGLADEGEGRETWDDEAEPEDSVVEIPLGPGHRLIKFGRSRKAAPGQTISYGNRFSSLEFF